MPVLRRIFSLRVIFAFICLLTVAIVSLPTTGQVFAAPKATGNYGSIAYSMSLQQPFPGYGDSQGASENNAWNACVQAGLKVGSNFTDDCNSAVWVHNGYMAIAIDFSWPDPQDRPWGTGWGTSPEIAKNYAKGVCEKYSKGESCTPQTWQTSNPQNSAKGGSGFGLRTQGYKAGNYIGKSGFVSVIGHNEPEGEKYWNYCGPGASQVLISAWTSNVPSIDKLATDEKTNIGKVGTYIDDMVTPINDAIGQTYYSKQNAGSQEDFSNMIGRNILDNHHPLITGLLTRYGNYRLNGWKKVDAEHIVTIYGFDFTSPSVGYVYYYETASKGAGAEEGPGPKRIYYNVFWSLVQQNKIQLAGK